MITDFYQKLEKYRSRAVKDDANSKIQSAKAYEKLFGYNFRGIDGSNPLHIASQYGRAECVTELL
jgi:hypothetical protein